MSHQEITSYLKHFKIDHLFHKETIDQMSLMYLDPGETLVDSGDQLETLYIQAEGKLKISTVFPNGRTLLLRFCQPSSLIGDIELINKERAAVQAETVSEVIVIAVPHAALQEREIKDAQFLHYLLEQVCHKLSTVSLSASVNVLTSVECRFASYLLSIAANKEHLRFKRGELETTKLTEIADLLGTSYRHLNRVIKRFVEEGMIEKQYSGIVIRDAEALRKLSDGKLYQ